TPSPDLDPKLRERLWETAVAAGRAVRYRGVGTVEFIVDSSGAFAFLEMNTRLQVEHPVTELTTGIDLVRMQIEIAAGLPLPSQEEVPRQSGHAIEARLTAETPQDGYLPSTGVIHRFCVPGDVRVDTGIADGVTITHHYDPMVAKVIAHAPTRTEAAARLANALTRSHIHGVDTNRDLLVRVLSDVEFLSGAVDTHFLERKGEVLTAPLAGDEALRSLAAAATLALQANNRAQARVLGSIPSGWRNVPFQRQGLTLMYGSRSVAVSYSLARGTADIAVDDSEVAIDAVHQASQDSVDATIEGVRRVYSVNIIGNEVYVDSPLGSARFELTPRFPNTDKATPSRKEMVARTPGTVVAVLVTRGDTVTAGQSVMVVEAMKMEQTISAPNAGRVTGIHFDVGDQVDAGVVLLEVEDEDD
ncbi:MAG: biotin/lipoyl-containing protein, partial [Acidimicrobiia bacterium]